jgi:hypothetical protein
MKLNLTHFLVILSMLFFTGFLQAQTPEGFTWQAKHSVNFGNGANHFTIKAASSGSGGEVELRLDAANGPVIGRAYFHHTGNSITYPDSSANFMDYECDLKQTLSGTHDVHMNFQDYTEPVLGGVLNIGSFKFDLVVASAITSKNRLHVYPAVPGLNPSPYYEYHIQKVSELNSANLADVTNWETPFAWFTNSPLKNTAAGYGYDVYIGGWSHTYTNFEMDPNTPIVVKITRKAVTGDDAPFGPIKSAAVHPAHKIDKYEIINGEVYVTMSKPALITVDIDGQLDTRNAPRVRDGWDGGAFPYSNSRKLGCHAVSIFANPFIEDKPDPNAAGVLVIKAGQLIPADINKSSWKTLYFEPGLHRLSAELNDKGEIVDRLWKPEDIIKLSSNKTIYIPGDAIVYGNFTNNYPSNSSSSNVRIYGHGTISGSKILFWKAWKEYPNSEYPNSQWQRAVLIDNAKNVRYEGITAADPANHTFTLTSGLNSVYEPNSIKWAKVIAWRPNSDATAINGHIIMEDCFLRTQDDGHYIGGAVTMRRVVFWHDVNGATFRGDFTTQRFSSDNASNVPKEILIEDIDVIYARGVFGFSDSKDFGIIQGAGGGNKILKDGVENTGQMVHFRNINVEDSKPVRHLFAMAAGKDNTGDLAGFRFENITYKAKQTFNWKGGIIGTPNSGYRNFVFDNVSINGQVFGTNNVNIPANIATNQYLYDMTFRVNHKIPSTDNTLVTTATNGLIQVNTETGTPGQVTVTAVPNAGYKFSSWSGDLSSTETVATITMDGDKGITANFSPITYTITKTAENGIIILEPALEKYAPGTVVTVKALGNIGYTFASWGGNLSGTQNPTTITVDGDKNIAATFSTVPTYSLSTNAANGSILLNPAGGVYNEGTIVKASVSADFGYQFRDWSGDIAGSVDSTTITMDANKSITANYNFVGSAIESFAVNCGGPAFTASDGTQYMADKFYTGGTVYNTTKAISGTEDDLLYQSERWGDISYNIDLPNGIYEVTLLFAEIYQTQPNQRVFNVLIEGKPVISKLDIWLVAGANAAYNKTVTIKIEDGQLNIAMQKVADNAKISAIKVVPAFNGKAFKLNTMSTNGSIAVDPAGTNFVEGTEVTLSAVPGIGFKFDNWTGDLTGEINPVKITLDGDKSVIANFSLSTGTNNVLNNLPEQIKFLQVFPNPFASKTTIQYQLSETTPVKLSVYNSLGKQVTTLVNEYQSAGNYSLEWNAPDGQGKQLENGLYLFKLETGKSVQTMKSVLLR